MRGTSAQWHKPPAGSRARLGVMSPWRLRAQEAKRLEPEHRLSGGPVQAPGHAKVPRLRTPFHVGAGAHSLGFSFLTEGAENS